VARLGVHSVQGAHVQVIGPGGAAVLAAGGPSTSADLVFLDSEKRPTWHAPPPEKKTL
jgi:hypothetical protein